ncbi:serine/threonine protein kinase [Xylariales sp. PMI_506]|nr:serine/threonine protein kinase [Xylariales sp. PMI_506]
MNNSGAAQSQVAPIKKLKITEPLDTFPLHIFDHAESLEHLDLSGTGLSSLPDDFGRLKKLKIAFFSNCRFTVFPEQLASCAELEMVAFRANGMVHIPEDAFPPRLRWLILTGNKISELPRSIGACHRLQKCMLSGNMLRELPDEMASCQALGLLRLSANRLESLPGWLFEMPHLSFLSFAGNPIASATTIASAAIPTLTNVSWSDIEVQGLLGEGASGIISKAHWKFEGDGKQVAIKLFKGDVTSDGTPLDEMRATITAGAHDNLISPLGEIQGHPDKKGLVMQLIPPMYSTLGLPPSLQSCTRDCFSQSTQLTLHQGLRILHGISSAASHLHSRGVAHGDMYAHNILFNKDGHALLGDFGAASIHDGYPVEPLEVLAFAHLVEDVWGLIKFNFSSVELKCSLQLEALHKRCSTRVVGERPRFSVIVEELDAISSVLHAARKHSLPSKPPAMVRVQA